MPQKQKEFNFEAYILGLQEQADIDRATAEMADLTARELYNLPSYTCAPQYLINRPVNHAMHGSIVNYPVDPVDVMRETLIDGTAYFRVDLSGIKYEQFVRKASIDNFTGQVYSVLLCWPIDEGKHYYWEAYFLTPDGKSCMYIQYNITTGDSEKDEDNLTAVFVDVLPYMPFVSSSWNSGIGIIDTVKAALLRLEISARVIAVENIERRGMIAYFTNIDNIDRIQKAPRSFGHGSKLLGDGDVKTLGSDAPGLQLLSQEQIDLWNNIEKATGVVSTEKIASLSGVSRLICEKPLIHLCEDIRDSFNKFLLNIYKQIPGFPKPEISYRPLNTAPSFDDPSKLIEVLDKALESNAITIEEWIVKIRWALDLKEN